MSADSGSRADYQDAVGERLRAIRRQQDLTLNEVEEASDGTWKAVVVGSYERGDRALSMVRLRGLAGFYRVPVRDLLPETRVADEGERRSSPDRAILDLRALPEGDEPPELAAVRRFAEAIQVQRGDFNGQVLTIRGTDLQTLAMAFGMNAPELYDRLARAGALFDPDA